MPETRCALYQRTSLADDDGPDKGLERLRRHAQAKGFAIVEELSDSRPRPHHERPEFKRLKELAASDQIDVVVTTSLSRLFPSVRVAVKVWDEWLERDVGLIALDDLIDTTSTAGRQQMRTAVKTLADMDRQRHAEATQCGLIAESLRRKGQYRGGHVKAVVDRLEVIELANMGLSYRAMVKEIKKRGGQISYGTLYRAVQDLIEAGKIDRALREERAQEISDRGGRPRKQAS